MIELKARSIQRLIDLILWNMGKDIECDGNLLLLFGFRRYRPPEHVMGSSRYHILFEGYEIVLWGFGMLVRRYGDGDSDGISIFINRHRYAPKILSMNASPDPYQDQGYCRDVGSCCYNSNDDGGGNGNYNCTGATASTIANVWSLSDLSMLREPACNEHDILRRLLFILFKLLYKYELWVHAIKGREYRVDCMKAFGTDYGIEGIIHMLRSLVCDGNIGGHG